MRTAALPPPRKHPPAGTSRERARIGAPGPAPEDARVCLPPGTRTRACVRCGTVLSGMAPVRASRRYCGVPCRRAVEYEVRRVRRHLAARDAELARRLELDRANNGLLSTLRSLDGRTWQDDLAAIRSEVAALRRRLDHLRHPRPARRPVLRARAAHTPGTSE